MLTEDKVTEIENKIKTSPDKLTETEIVDYIEHNYDVIKNSTTDQKQQIEKIEEFFKVFKDIQNLDLKTLINGRLSFYKILYIRLISGDNLTSEDFEVVKRRTIPSSCSIFRSENQSLACKIAIDKISKLFMTYEGTDISILTKLQNLYTGMRIIDEKVKEGSRLVNPGYGAYQIYSNIFLLEHPEKVDRGLYACIIQDINACIVPSLLNVNVLINFLYKLHIADAKDYIDIFFKHQLKTQFNLKGFSRDLGHIAEHIILRSSIPPSGKIAVMRIIVENLFNKDKENSLIEHINTEDGAILGKFLLEVQENFSKLKGLNDQDAKANETLLNIVNNEKFLLKEKIEKKIKKLGPLGPKDQDVTPEVFKDEKFQGLKHIKIKKESSIPKKKPKEEPRNHKEHKEDPKTTNETSFTTPNSDTRSTTDTSTRSTATTDSTSTSNSEGFLPSVSTTTSTKEKPKTTPVKPPITPKTVDISAEAEKRLKQREMFLEAISSYDLKSNISHPYRNKVENAIEILEEAKKSKKLYNLLNHKDSSGKSIPFLTNDLYLLEVIRSYGYDFSKGLYNGDLPIIYHIKNKHQLSEKVIDLFVSSCNKDQCIDLLNKLQNLENSPSLELASKAVKSRILKSFNIDIISRSDIEKLKQSILASAKEFEAMKEKEKLVLVSSIESPGAKKVLGEFVKSTELDKVNNWVSVSTKNNRLNKKRSIYFSVFISDLIGAYFLGKKLGTIPEPLIKYTKIFYGFADNNPKIRNFLLAVSTICLALSGIKWFKENSAIADKKPKQTEEFVKFVVNRLEKNPDVVFTK